MFGCRLAISPISPAGGGFVPWRNRTGNSPSPIPGRWAYVLCSLRSLQATIFRLLAEDYKGWGHGLPDLLLWHEDGTPLVYVCTTLSH
jgi:hypothetical protein